MEKVNTEALIIYSTIIILVIVVMMMLIYAFFLRKKSDLILTQKEKEASFQRELSLAQIEMKEQTLSYIGRELHDDIGQKLTVAKLLTVQVLPRVSDEDKSNLSEVSDLLGESMQDIRNMSKNYISDQIEFFGFTHSLERELGRIRKLQIMEVNYEKNVEEIDIDPKHELILFRMVQEMINNVMKHSRANVLNIKVTDSYEKLRIETIDNGIGFQEKERNGSGLTNIRNRAGLLGAKLKINSALNSGTAIIIEYDKNKVPLWNR